MVDEMTVQTQRPSVIPYLAGGAVIGGAAGAGLAKFANFGIQAPRYSNWKEAVEDVNKDDKFMRSQIDKGGDNKADWETLKTKAQAVKDANQRLTDAIPEGFEAKAELEAVIDKETALAEAEEALEKKKKEVFDKEVENIKTKLQKEGEFHKFKDTDYNKEMFENLLKSEKEEEKALLKELIEDTAGYKKEIAKPDFAKAQKDAVTSATTALEEAKQNLAEKDTKKLASGIKETVKNAKEAVTKAENGAKEGLKEEVLSKLKGASIWKTAAVGAAVLGLAGLLLRPKAEEV